MCGIADADAGGDTKLLLWINRCPSLGKSATIRNVCGYEISSHYSSARWTERYFTSGDFAKEYLQAATLLSTRKIDFRAKRATFLYPTLKQLRMFNSTAMKNEVIDEARTMHFTNQKQMGSFLTVSSLSFLTPSICSDIKHIVTSLSREFRSFNKRKLKVIQLSGRGESRM